MQHLLWLIPALLLAGCAGLRHDAGPVDARREQILAECRLELEKAQASATSRYQANDVFFACLDAKGY